MRCALLIPALMIPALFAATPAAAQPVVSPQIERAIADPALPGQLGDVAAAVTRAVMALPVGEIEAAVEGRTASPGDRRRTVGDKLGGNGMDRAIGRQVAQQTGRMQQSAQAMARALPAIERALADAVAPIDRATANLPDPTYPYR